MNRHAEKPLKEARHDESEPLDSVFEDAIAVIHFCAGCGKVEAERESS
jgi:hypothetical protein